MTNRVAKYATHGAVMAGTLSYLSGGASGITIMGQRMSVPVAGAVLGVATSVANDLIHSYVLPMTPFGDKANLKDLTATGVAVASGAGSTLAASYLMNPALLTTPGTNQLMLVGAVSEIASEWLFSSVIAPTLNLPKE